MHGHFEPISGVLRIFEDGKEYGDEYVWCVTVKFLTRTKVELCGIIKAPTPSMWKAIRTTLWNMNIDTVVMERKLSDGTIVKKEIQR